MKYLSPHIKKEIFESIAVMRQHHFKPCVLYFLTIGSLGLLRTPLNPARLRLNPPLPSWLETTSPTDDCSYYYHSMGLRLIQTLDPIYPGSRTITTPNWNKMMLLSNLAHCTLVCIFVIIKSIHCLVNCYQRMLWDA